MHTACGQITKDYNKTEIMEKKVVNQTHITPIQITKLNLTDAEWKSISRRRV
jgi:ABC-type xylose transport system substrate-binding protein